MYKIKISTHAKVCQLLAQYGIKIKPFWPNIKSLEQKNILDLEGFDMAI